MTNQQWNNEQWNQGTPGGWQPQADPQWQQQPPQQPAPPPGQQPGWGGPPQQSAPPWPPQQDPAWGQQQPWQPAPPPPPKRSGGLGNVFDFSFSKLALPQAAGSIFLISVIVIAVGWVFNFASVLRYGADFMGMGGSFIGGLAAALVTILSIRILLEIAVFLARIAEQTKPAAKDDTDDAKGPDPAGQI